MTENASGSTSFHPDFFPFLKELARNNNRGWFAKNKARYETHVRDPCLQFIREIGPKLGRLSPHLVADPRPVGGSMTRIYRDIRFSKDKSPYKTGVGIHFHHDAMGRISDNLPGFYLHLEPGECIVASGIWRPDPPMLKSIRQAIVSRSGEWKKIRQAVPKLEGETLKRPPPGFDPDHAFVDDLKRKDFIASEPIKDAVVSGRGFQNDFLTRCHSLDPLNRFVARAIDLPW